MILLLAEKIWHSFLEWMVWMLIQLSKGCCNNVSTLGRKDFDIPFKGWMNCWFDRDINIHSIHCFNNMKKRKTRLTYNCAHLRSTKESLTIWVKIFWLKIFWVKIFLSENFLGEFFLGEHFFGSKFFLVKIFGVKIFFNWKFFGWIFFGWKFFWVKIFFCENFVVQPESDKSFVLQRSSLFF